MESAFEGPVRIGTRGSPLALAQAAEVAQRLVAAHPALAEPGAIETIVIATTGDRVRDRTLSEIGGKGLFVKEIEEALLTEIIDLAVHSMKDMTTWLPDGLTIACILPREDPRDVLFMNAVGGENGESAVGEGLAALPAGAVVGTASLRRQAQVLAQRPDVRVVPLRGNVGTRLKRLDEGQMDATLLALAGLKRLAWSGREPLVLSPEEMLPAVGQGAIGVEIRAGDEQSRTLLEAVACPESGRGVAAERAMLAVLDGSCRTPIGGLATMGRSQDMTLEGLVAKPDGSRVHRIRRHGSTDDAERLGDEVGAELKALAGRSFF